MKTLRTWRGRRRGAVGRIGLVVTAALLLSVTVGCGGPPGWRAEGWTPAHEQIGEFVPVPARIQMMAAM